jgi:hypothetical protein
MRLETKNIRFCETAILKIYGHFKFQDTKIQIT